MLAKIRKAGSLKKKGKYSKRTTEHDFELKDKELTYYTAKGVAKAILLKDALITDGGKKKKNFSITSKGRKYQLEAQNVKEKKKWLDAIEKAKAGTLPARKRLSILNMTADTEVVSESSSRSKTRPRSSGSQSHKSPKSQQSRNSGKKSSSPKGKSPTGKSDQKPGVKLSSPKSEEKSKCIPPPEEKTSSPPEEKTSSPPEEKTSSPCEENQSCVTESKEKIAGELNIIVKSNYPPVEVFQKIPGSISLKDLKKLLVSATSIDQNDIESYVIYVVSFGKDVVELSTLMNTLDVQSVSKCIPNNSILYLAAPAGIKPMKKFVRKKAEGEEEEEKKK